jgi:flagellar hook-associated protein 2
MGTVSSTPTVNTPTFSGVSTFSSSFQQYLQREVSIAELPLQGMQNQLSTLQSQQSALEGLQSTFSSLESSIQSLATAAQGGLAATVSDPSVIQATASSNALPGTYSITVTGLGSNTTTLSLSGNVAGLAGNGSGNIPTVTNPTSQNISNSSSFTLTVNGTNTTITPSGNSLEDLTTAINNAGAGVTATIVNVGTNSSPDYRLALASDNLATDTIQLNDGSTNLLATNGETGYSGGAPATYSVNGSAPIDSDSATVTLAPGLTANLLEAAPGTPATITVGQNYGNLESGLDNFVSAYNAALSAVNQQHGQNAGTLLGSGVVLSLGQSLSSLTQYFSGSGAIQSLSDLGITVGSSGNLTFDPSTFANLNSTDITQFLGGLTSGGFLESANSAITAMEDPATGAIQESLTSIQNQITSENAQISSQTTQINNMESNLEQQLSQADASIAVLQEQVTVLSTLFSSSENTTANDNVTQTSSGSIL